MANLSRLLAPSWLLWLFIAGCSQPQTSPLSRDDLFQDGFQVGETGAWRIEGDTVARAFIDDGLLFIEIDASQTIHFATLSEPAFEDFVLEVDVTLLEGDPESSAGVLFRMSAPDQFYRFEITGSGLYMIERRNGDGSWTRFVERWTQSDAIRVGLLESNRLKIVAEGANLSLFVNDQLLLQTSDDVYASGKIALDAGTFGLPGLKVAFDNVNVRKP